MILVNALGLPGIKRLGKGVLAEIRVLAEIGE
jgi:hypothetical protein